MSKKLVKLFTYGILKFPHNIREEGGVNIVEDCMVTGHKMFLYNKSYPITEVTGRESDVIYGTLFEVPEKVILKHYDEIEGYSPKREPQYNLYNREQVTVVTPNGEHVNAQMYVANPFYFQYFFLAKTQIPSGKFEDGFIIRNQ